MTYDIVIRGGRIVDGTGRAGFTADIAVADGAIAAIGKVAEKAKREIAADGLRQRRLEAQHVAQGGAVGER